MKQTEKCKDCKNRYSQKCFYCINYEYHTNDAAQTLIDNYESNEKDYTEDINHENGNYENIGCGCGDHFIGHKRRVLCKECKNNLISVEELKHER